MTADGYVKVKALGLHWRNGALLACEIRELDGTLKGVRPLGGIVKLGEATEQMKRNDHDN